MQGTYWRNEGFNPMKYCLPFLTPICKTRPSANMLKDQIEEMITELQTGISKVGDAPKSPASPSEIAGMTNGELNTQIGLLWTFAGEVKNTIQY